MTSDEQKRWEALLYPDTQVLRNLHEITNESKWEKIESRLTSRRQALLPPEGLIGDSVADEIQAYHKHIFQDCYTWAGEFRTVNMAKENLLSKELSHFAPWETINDRLAELDNYVSALNNADFAEKIDLLSRLHSELNEIHPFREGNGRTTRAFMTGLATRHNINIDWSTAHKAQIIAAAGSMLNDQLDSAPWKKLYTHIASIATWEDETETLGIYELDTIDQATLKTTGNFPTQTNTSLLEEGDLTFHYEPANPTAQNYEPHNQQTPTPQSKKNQDTSLEN